MANTTAAIMALPAPLENIRLVGDEEKHATLMYFGETSSLPDNAKETLVESVKMACDMLFPFSERIREIARLGSDTPPALVAKLTDENLSQVRNLFKMNPAVDGYLSNTAQYPSFTPHVTLGYPDYVEEAILRTLAAQLYRVKFDRLAVWWNEERIEIPLSRIVEGDEMAMADAVGEFMAHHGVKGMKWGVRKDQFGIGGINLASGHQQVQSVSRGPVGRTVDAKAAAAAHEDTYKVLDGIVGHLAKDSTAAAYSSQMQKHQPVNGFKSPKEVDAYRANASKTLSGLISDHLASEGVTGITVKTFPLGPNQFQYIIGDKKTVDAALGDIEVKKIAHADVEPVGVKMAVEFLWNEDGTPNGYSIIDAPQHLTHSDLEHSGVKGMKWGVRKDERALGRHDQQLNIHQRSQVKIASTISAVSTAAMTSNAAATLFQLQNRWERLKVLNAIADQAQNNPFIDQAGKEALRATKNSVIKGIVASAVATTVVSTAVGIAANRTAKAYFAPVHKVYGDAKPRINREIKKLGNDLKTGKRPKMTSREYHAEVAKIVEKHMTKDMNNATMPFHELARSQLGLEMGSQKLNVSFSKLPNTPLVEKMTITTPTGMKMVKAVKNVRHDDLEEQIQIPDLEIYFDYKFDEDGLISEWSSPTIEVANELFEGTFDLQKLLASEGGETVDNNEDSLAQTDTVVDDVLEHAGVKGMKWGVRRRVDPKTGLVARSSSADQIHVDRIAKKLHNGGVSALSNKDLQEFSQRIQREQEFNRALASQEAQRSKPFIQRFLATQGKKQFNRVVDKAVDIAVEKALESAGIKIGAKGGKNAKRNTEIGNLLQETSVRLKPKKKGGGGGN